MHIETSPARYSPALSSTPGIRLTLNRSGIPAGETEYIWNASYGRFLSWEPPEYTVHLLGSGEVSQREALYWTFTDRPGPAQEPVRITVTARDMRSGSVTGSAAVILDWEGETTVIVRENR